ncbi:MAG: DMT family transporter [Burkholderiaceae bacterium]
MTRTRVLVRSPVIAALAAAVLFGASTPFAKQLIGDVSPILLAGLLYLGSGIGLSLVRLFLPKNEKQLTMTPIAVADWPWLAGAIIFGGVLGPALLMFGLTRTSAATASLLLNLEAVLTAALAWIAFKEHAHARTVLGMLLIVAGGVVLSWPQTSMASGWIGSMMIAAACVCWAIDNNLTRKISAGDALFIAAAKGLVAGVVNIGLASIYGTLLPAWPLIIAAMFLGWLGYGISLALFVLALRGLGTARTGAYFSTAPYVGALLAIAVFGEPADRVLVISGALMAAGVWLHLTEHHLHGHTHESIAHDHSHSHDDHHQHAHDFTWDGSEPHSHPHRHQPLTHSHAHFPDIHHRHRHQRADHS